MGVIHKSEIRSSTQESQNHRFAGYCGTFKMSESTPVQDEKEWPMEAERDIERSNVAIDQNRDTFLPRPSDDPNDPLNWSIYLKVCLPRQIPNPTLNRAPS
jgi:hypothetical protein